MKKVLAMVLALTMVFALCACGSASETASTAAPAAETTEAAAETVETDEAAAEAVDASDFIVGAIYINSQNDTAGYTFQHHSGITAAMEALGMDTATQLLIVDNVAEDYTAVCTAIDTLAGQGANIIFGISFGYIDAMNDKAAEYPDIAFSHGTGYLSNDTNFNNYFGRIYQARYLAGIAAGMKSLELGNNNIGYVAAWNLEYAETCSGINGFALGALSANPDAVIHVSEIATWGDESLERQAAETLVDTYDCCVISQHCDSAQPQIVAQEKGVYGCGYNSDMTADAPEAELTSAIWHWDAYYKTAIEAAMACNGDGSQFVSNMGGGAYYAGLAEGFVGLADLTDNCADGTAEIIEKVSELIVSGAWDVFSGVKLSYEDGEIVMTDADLLTNEGEVIVEAGGASVEDGVITGSMNYNVAGVIAH